MSGEAILEAAIEAILFAAGEPVPRERLLAAFDPEERPAAEPALAAVLGRYGPRPAGGILVEEVAGGLRLVTRPDLQPYLQRYFESGGRAKLSMAALETLAIVAYRQPVTTPEIQELRGVHPGGVVKTLLERRLIRICGRKEVVGKPFLYGTTREFLLQFGLNSLAQLPPLEEFEETLGLAGEEAAAGVEPTAGGPAAGPVAAGEEEGAGDVAAALAAAALDPAARLAPGEGQ